MNKFIKEQLNRITAPISDWNDSSLKIHVGKQGAKPKAEGFNLGMTYNIKIESYIINPSPTFTLAANWNGGTVPPEENLTATVLQIAGNMVKFSCKGKTTNEHWDGWLPRKSITIL